MTSETRSYGSIWSDLTTVAFTQGYINAGGIRTRFISSGTSDKPLLLMLHGVGGHAEAFARNFEAHGEHFWTVAIDLLGHGWTDKPDTDYEIKHYAKHVLDVIKALGRNKALISGESIGGWIATYIAVHHPQVIEKMVLNTAGGWTAHPEVMARLKKLSNQAAQNPTPDFIRQRLEFLMYDKSMVSDDLVETRRRIYAQPGFGETMKRIMCLQETDIRRRNLITEAEYRSIKTPTLVLWTSHDPTATPEEGKQISDMIAGSRYVVMNRCGHWPQYEDPPLFNKIHLEFLLDRKTA